MSSAAIKSTSLRIRMARKVISSRLPIGVLTMYSTALVRLLLTVLDIVIVGEKHDIGRRSFRMVRDTVSLFFPSPRVNIIVALRYLEMQSAFETSRGFLNVFRGVLRKFASEDCCLMSTNHSLISLKP